MASDSSLVETAQMVINVSPDNSPTETVLVTSISGEAPADLSDATHIILPGSTHGMSQAEYQSDSELKSVPCTVRENEENRTTLLDMNQFMEVVYMYKCKFCSFNTNSADNMSQHVLNVHIERSLPGQPVSLDTEVLPEAEDSVIGTDHGYNTTVNLEHITHLCAGDEVTDKRDETTVPMIQESNIDDVDSDVVHNVDSVTADAATVMVDHGQQGYPVDNEDCIAANVIDITAIEQTEHAADQHIGEDNLVAGDDLESKGDVETPCQEIFICGQCTLSFMSIDQCKQHMFEAHNLSLMTELETEEVQNVAELQSISATIRDHNLDKVSIGTQAVMRKKPGRKRKHKDDDNEQDMPDIIQEIKKEAPDDLIDMPIFSEDFLSERVREGKRRIKMPKSLLDDYYVSKSRDKKCPPLMAVSKKQTAKNRVDVQKHRLKCEIYLCKAKFHTESSLAEHEKCHNKTLDGKLRKGYTCTQCTFSSQQWNPTRLHMWTKHNINLDLLVCDQCEYHTDACYKMDIHKQIHKEDKSYSCELCDKSYKQLSQLLHHAISHKDGANIQAKIMNDNRQCHICHRIMADSKSLSKHIQYVHEKVKAYSCEFCGHTAARKHMLQVHLRTHTGERPHKCDLCSFATSDHNTLRRHRLRHTGEKPYKCRYCSYACIQAIALKIHMKNKHHDEKGLFYCKLCHYHTVNEKYWENHQQDHKNGLIEEQVNQKFLPEHDHKRKKNMISVKQMMQDLNLPVRLMNSVNNPSPVTIQEMAPSEAVVHEVMDITEVIPINSSMTNSDKVQFVYYAIGDNNDKPQLVPIMPEGFMVQDGSQSVITTTRQNIQTVQLSQDGTEETLSFTMEPGVDGESQIVLAPMTENKVEMIKLESTPVEVDTSALEAIEVMNQSSSNIQ